MSNKKKKLIFNYNVPKGKILCNDCQEELGLKTFIYSNKHYCEECYENVRQTCSICLKKEKNRNEFYSVRVEDDGMKWIVVCINCSSMLNTCSRDGCDVVFKSSEDKKCEQCDSQYCKFHKIEHQCKTNEPSYLFRPASNQHYNGSPNLAREIKIPWLVGVELEAVNGNANDLASKLERRVGISHDGSLQGKSPIEMQLPPSGNEKLEQLIRHVSRVSRNSGYKVNKTCGMHIHLDASSFRTDVKHVFKLISTYYAIEPVIFAMLPMSRRNNKYALPLRNWIGEAKMLELSRNPLKTIDALQVMWYKSSTLDQARGFRMGKYDTSRYHGFNLHSFFNIGTIEMRYHHGTLNRTKITNWINFHLMIFDWVSKKYNQNVVDAIFFTDSIDDKFKLMCRHFKFNKTIRRYVRRNIRKFAGNENEDRD